MSYHNIKPYQISSPSCTTAHLLAYVFLSKFEPPAQNPGSATVLYQPSSAMVSSYKEQHARSAPVNSIHVQYARRIYDVQIRYIPRRTGKSLMCVELEVRGKHTTQHLKSV